MKRGSRWCAVPSVGGIPSGSGAPDCDAGLAANRCCGATWLMAPKLSIAVVEQDHDRALMIVDGLREAGEYDITVLGDVTGLARRLAALAPDVVLIDLESPDRDVLDALTLASTPVERPVAMFVDRSDDGVMRAAIEAGVSAYVVGGLSRERIQPGAHRGDRPLPRRRAAARRARRDQGGARGAQGGRPRQGHADEGQGPRARRRPMPRCAARPWRRAARSPTSRRR